VLPLLVLGFIDSTLVMQHSDASSSSNCRDWRALLRHVSESLLLQLLTLAANGKVLDVDSASKLPRGIALRVHLQNFRITSLKRTTEAGWLACLTWRQSVIILQH
jgi:hypothetical protein